MATGHKTKDGKTIHKPISEVPGAQKSTHAIKYDVHYWNAQAKPFVDKECIYSNCTFC